MKCGTRNQKKKKSTESTKINRINKESQRSIQRSIRSDLNVSVYIRSVLKCLYTDQTIYILLIHVEIHTRKQTTMAFEPRLLVLAKMAGYPAWPAFVMPQDQIPKSVLSAKKKSSAYCVIFIPDGDFYWMSEKNLELLLKDKLKDKLAKLPANYKITKKSGRTTNITDALFAAKSLDFDKFMEKVRKEKAEAELEDDDDDDDDDDGEDEEEVIKEEAPKRGRKRKSEEEKLTVKRTKKEDAPKEVKKVGRPKSDSVTTSGTGRNGRSARMKEEINPPSDKPTQTPPVKKSRDEIQKFPITEEEKQEHLWLCRIKLQKTLIQRNQSSTPTDTKNLPPPTADELSVARLILYRLVDFPVNVELLKKTKIHKVLKCILKDAELNYEDSFKLHERCQEVLSKWDNMIQEVRRQKKLNIDDSETSINA